MDADLGARNAVIVNPIKRHRKRRGLTQTQLAQIVGCHQATISKLERNIDKNATVHLLERIAAALGIDVTEIIGREEIERRFLAALREASPERRRAVLLLLEGDDE